MWARIPRFVVALSVLGACGSETESTGDHGGTPATGGGAGSPATGGSAGSAATGGDAGVSGGRAGSGDAARAGDGASSDGGVGEAAGRAGGGAGGMGAGGRRPWDDLATCTRNSDCLPTEGCLSNRFNGVESRCVPTGSGCASDAWMPTCVACNSTSGGACPCVDWALYCAPTSVGRKPLCTDSGTNLLCA
ncbi:MAG TPA: hypothetical protein VF103_19355, partial [Polyangiaceae bacterium]